MGQGTIQRIPRIQSIQRSSFAMPAMPFAVPFAMFGYVDYVARGAQLEFQSDSI